MYKGIVRALHYIFLSNVQSRLWIHTISLAYNYRRAWACAVAPPSDLTIRGWTTIHHRRWNKIWGKPHVWRQGNLSVTSASEPREYLKHMRWDFPQNARVLEKLQCNAFLYLTLEVSLTLYVLSKSWPNCFSSFNRPSWQHCARAFAFSWHFAIIVVKILWISQKYNTVRKNTLKLM